MSSEAFQPSLHPGNSSEKMPTLAPEADQKPKVAVIIVSFNSEPVIADCLHALLSSDYENIEVVVVDNGSRDRTRELVREKFPGVRLIQAGRNLGFAGGCNVGFEATDADIVVLLNDDAFVESDTISQMVSFLVSEPEAGVVGCKVLYPDGKKLQHAGAAILPNGLTRHYGYGQADQGQYDRVFDCAYVTGAAMAIRREVLEQLGPFDPGYYPAYYEEAEYCARVRRLGYRVVYLPTARVRHQESRGAKKGSFDFLRMYHSGRLRFVLKNFELPELLGFAKEELRWLFGYGLRHQARPLLVAYLRTLPKLGNILRARRRDWVRERINPKLVKSDIDFADSVFYNQLEGFSPILDWSGTRVRGVARKASFRLLAPDNPRSLGLALAASNGRRVRLCVLANGRRLAQVTLGDYLQTLRLPIPKSARSAIRGGLVRITLKLKEAEGLSRDGRPSVVVKRAWVQ